MIYFITPELKIMKMSKSNVKNHKVIFKGSLGLCVHIKHNPDRYKELCKKVDKLLIAMFPKDFCAAK